MFGTDIFKKTCDLDLERLMAACQQHHDQVPNARVSNRGGGYQGHNFQDQEFTDMILQCFPRNPEVNLPPVRVQSWVNINGFGAWNALHNHIDTNAVISGVFYVKAPPNTGNIFFYDPRYLSSVGSYYQYYYPGDGGYMEVEPQPNMLLFFPPSLFHMVGPNLTQQERCSIAFNIMVVSTHQS
jgi:hypothetical protein